MFYRCIKRKCTGNRVPHWSKVRRRPRSARRWEMRSPKTHGECNTNSGKVQCIYNSIHRRRVRPVAPMTLGWPRADTRIRDNGVRELKWTDPAQYLSDVRTGQLNQYMIGSALACEWLSNRLQSHLQHSVEQQTAHDAADTPSDVRLLVTMKICKKIVEERHSRRGRLRRFQGILHGRKVPLWLLAGWVARGVDSQADRSRCYLRICHIAVLAHSERYCIRASSVWPCVCFIAPKP
jgi:hypothetical protein